ncbi:hypothetical protein CK203_075737 [Vitis vinifera]|uniref:Uncharacterized protein n=1 Tax=Vitis vinifera TaxID=29760 RepID=A0A438F6Z9_VITVI|nr:hypothetical protein CK203_075737 [Vitis vinifera]
MWRCPTFLQIAQWRRCRLDDAGVVLRWRNIEIDLPRGNPPTKPNLPSPTDVKTVGIWKQGKGNFVKRDCRFTLSMGTVPSTPRWSSARPVDTAEYLIGTFVGEKSFPLTSDFWQKLLELPLSLQWPSHRVRQACELFGPLGTRENQGERKQTEN